MPRIHFIEREKHFLRIEDNIFESWCWNVPPRTAQALIGGDIYFHEKQKEPSYYGGKILDYRIHESDEGAYAGCRGRVIFTFKYSREHKNVSAGEGGWAFMMKIVLDDNDTAV